MDLMLQMGSGVICVFGGVVTSVLIILTQSSSMETASYTCLGAPHFLVPEAGVVRPVHALLESSVLASFPWSPGLWLGWTVLTQAAS